MAAGSGLCPRELTSGISVQGAVCFDKTQERAGKAAHAMAWSPAPVTWGGWASPCLVSGGRRGESHIREQESSGGCLGAPGHRSVVRSGVLGDQGLCTALRAGGRGQALHGLPLALLGLVVHQDAGRHQDSADG